ncbi:MAG: type I-U CRISPR-associated protein Csx17 [Verrucomicrobiota bacterium]|nr:type I-U CRISPR-associated protein Csx17 [Limisphaera sp.]MDW8382883.1 type I-U CRISPR-associated protein Csx17 [Verrucomicrobiota bacterium]
MNVLPLTGCAPTPLAHYLKALGILRLVAQQVDSEAAGCWHRDVFILHSRLERDGLQDFFLHHYQPTPILAPWNGGSGFYPKDNQDALRALGKSEASRFACYREAIASARMALARIGASAKPNGGQKERLLLVCRNTFPEEALVWLDAAYLLTEEGAKYPPLLGTGGNDGRLEFTNNFMQRLTEVLDPATGQPAVTAAPLLRNALFGEADNLPLSRAPIGQFFPGQAGGANATTGFDAESFINPWDFILMLEGALLFAAAAVRRLQYSEPGVLAYPFCVRQAAAGYASAAAGDETGARAEMWMPLWERPTRLLELAAILAEGRAQIGARAARHGVDFARAIVSLGVDRGLTAFQRYGFQVRNGLAYFATPLGRFAVRRNVHADLLSEADRWLDNLRRIASPVAERAPASVTRALREVEERILGLCHEGSPQHVQGVLVALGQAEKALARSFAWTTGRNDQSLGPKISPLYGLSGRWLREADDGSTEFRLAASLASIIGQFKNADGQLFWLPLRSHLEPVREVSGPGFRRFQWDDPPTNDVLWREADPIAFLNAVFARRLLRAIQAGFSELPDRGMPAALTDAAVFIDGQTDDGRLVDLLWGLCLVDWTAVDWRTDVTRLRPRPDEVKVLPPSLFSLLRLAFLRPGERGDLPPIPLTPAIHRLAAAGNGFEASRMAARRLRASQLPSALDQITVGGNAARRTAAALLFPLSRPDLARLAELVLKPQTECITP